MASDAVGRDVIYELHHALDPVILPVAGRILKLKCFATARDHFEWDLLGDIGIINLLRRDYLRHGSLKRTFRLYQSSRLDPRSDRYESLLAMLVVTIVGTVVGGVILEHYKDNRHKLAAWLKRMREEAGLFRVGQAIRDVFAVVYQNRDRIRHIAKFCSSSPQRVLADLRTVVRCCTARAMHDESVLSYAEYRALVDHFLGQNRVLDEFALLDRFTSYESNRPRSHKHIDIGKVMLAIEAYSKGTLAQCLDTVGAKLNLPENTDTADLFHGLPAAPGAVTGISHVHGKRRKRTQHAVILVADSATFSPIDIDCLTSSAGAVTTNCGMTGHIPVICRGLGIGCVVLRSEDFSRIQNGDRIGLCGTKGVVGTGVLVELERNEDPAHQ